MPQTAAPLHPLSHSVIENSYAQLPSHFYQQVAPTPLESPYLVSINIEVAKQLGINPYSLDPEDLIQICSGQGLLAGGQPLAMKYAGHQFGVYNPQLGDGRGLLLGELITPQGQRFDLHLKGAGKTAFSRFGDGRAVLRSSIREYLAGAALKGLNIPTTQALCLVGSASQAYRDGFNEPCATMLRVTECHIRFGHFEHLYHRQQFDDLKLLADYCLKRYFPMLLKRANPYLDMLQEVIRRNARLVALWQAYGFVHGVMNTDNMSLIGETFDYGPFMFMDQYQPEQVSNHSDHQGRYAFKRQPEVMLWNLYCLAQSFVPLVAQHGLEAKALLEQALTEFEPCYQSHYLQLMRQRLGLQFEQTEDEQLIDDLLVLLKSQKTDGTLFFRHLSEQPSTGLHTGLGAVVEHPQAFTYWLNQYQTRLTLEQVSEQARQTQMQQVNPVYILRNYMAEEAIKAAHQGDFTLVNQLLGLLRNPFQKQSDDNQYAEEAPD
ncbi:Uncharacterized conserved protein YdiU, UPF0061 family [Oceanospirillum multiglobuliferum]|uniref:Protein nucleotidyltransferase YdiU n=1 Tax=Oceanospirillum multiglobuliferum TaxID=64969 RepID=A0A1T4NCW8_9GAMM|nr:YdiU family protein [Oceanospirillum multiglobuliferum]OPX55912.1 hypothetical protein BTE48_06885 [Oceanospirillum multiglobuliferum]SJZ76628.1 Uncharacterized conserved protein YdiU, UPF0061 family [Oceanospirillum multiglobuliferum]